MRIHKIDIIIMNNLPLSSLDFVTVPSLHFVTVTFVGVFAVALNRPPIIRLEICAPFLVLERLYFNQLGTHEAAINRHNPITKYGLYA